jgi:uncharacterized damage-inducible protein DinB
MSVESLFVSTCAAKLRQLMGRIEVCVGRLTEDQVWARGHENENAVGNLLLHLTGNVRQWILSGLGGQPDTRVRAREFSTEQGIAPAELTVRLRETVEEAADVISGLTAEQLPQTFVIQGLTVTGLEAVIHVLEHFGQHTGQIIFATKNLTGEDLGLVAPKHAGSIPTTT